MSERPVRPKISVHLGETVPNGEFGSSRFDYTVEVEVADGSNVQDALNVYETIVEAKCRERRAKVAAERPAAKPASAADHVLRGEPATVPKAPAPVDEAALAKLPWKPSKYEGHYIFSDTPEASGLKSALEKAEKKSLRLGGNFYALEGRYIGRRPLKEAKA